MISAMNRADRLAERGVSMNNSTFIVGLARCIGPLVKYFQASGNARALELAVCLKNKCVDEFFTAEGTYDRDTFGETDGSFRCCLGCILPRVTAMIVRAGTHTHSTTCVLSGLAMLAEVQTQRFV